MISELSCGSVASPNVPKLLVAPRREHSRKPDGTYERIERLLPGPYLEMFARRSRPGWDAWGEQTALFDQGSVSTRRRPSRTTPVDLKTGVCDAAIAAPAATARARAR